MIEVGDGIVRAILDGVFIGIMIMFGYFLGYARRDDNS